MPQWSCNYQRFDKSAVTQCVHSPTICIRRNEIKIPFWDIDKKYEWKYLFISNLSIRFYIQNVQRCADYFHFLNENIFIFWLAMCVLHRSLVIRLKRLLGLAWRGNALRTDFLIFFLTMFRSSCCLLTLSSSGGCSGAMNNVSPSANIWFTRNALEILRRKLYYMWLRFYLYIAHHSK